jgi:hypothetical protein
MRFIHALIDKAPGRREQHGIKIPRFFLAAPAVSSPNIVWIYDLLYKPDFTFQTNHCLGAINAYASNSSYFDYLSAISIPFDDFPLNCTT